MKKILLLVAAVLVLSVPAFAVDVVYFSESNLTLYGADQRTLTLNGDSGVYYFVRSNGSDSVTIYAISENNTGTIEMEITTPGQSGSEGGIFSHWYSFASGYYYTEIKPWNGAFTLEPQISVFPSGTSFDDIAQSFSDFLANPPVTGTYSTFVIPRGNVLYFRVAQSSEVKFQSAFSDNSPVFGSNNIFGAWGDTGQRVKTVSGLPVAGTTFPLPDSNAIAWQKAPPYNVLGQTKIGVFSLQCSGGDLYTFYNPAYVGVQSSNGSFGSTSIGSNVTVSGYFSFLRIYSLQQLMDTSSSNDDFDTYVDGTPQENDNNVVWTDQDDNVSAPVSGGDNQDDEPISSINLIDGIKQILHNILTEIENIFTFGFSAIRSLVELMREFLTVFDDLYTWLPTELHTLLFACISVALVIGIFKVFL